MGNPLRCSLNDITVEDLQSGKYSSLVGGASSQRGVGTESTPLAITEAAKRPSTSATVGEPGSEDESSSDGGGVPVKPVDTGNELTNKNAPFG